MPQTDFGPVNIEQGDSANFVLEFLDSNGIITTPSSADLVVSYTNTSNITQTDTVSLTLAGSFWTGTWSSSSAALGIATWTLTGAGSTAVAQTGYLRIING